MPSPSQLRLRPSVEVLEDRDVPSVAQAVQDVQLIRGVVPAIRDNFAALSQIPEVGDILQTMRDTSASDYAELTEAQQEIADALNDQLQALEQQRAAANQQIMDEYNTNIGLTDAAVASLPPETQQAIAVAVAEYKRALGQDAAAKIVRTGDIIGGQEVFSIEYASQLNTFLVPIIAQSVDNFVQSDQLLQSLGASDDDSSNGGGSDAPGGGQYVRLGITLEDGTLLYGIDRDGDGVANGDDTYILVNGQYQPITLPF